MDILEVDKVHVMDGDEDRTLNKKRNWIIQKYSGVFFCEENDRDAAVSILQIERQTNLFWKKWSQTNAATPNISFHIKKKSLKHFSVRITASCNNAENL